MFFNWRELSRAQAPVSQQAAVCLVLCCSATPASEPAWPTPCVILLSLPKNLGEIYSRKADRCITLVVSFQLSNKARQAKRQRRAPARLTSCKSLSVFRVKGCIFARLHISLRITECIALEEVNIICLCLLDIAYTFGAKCFVMLIVHSIWISKTKNRCG